MTGMWITRVLELMRAGIDRLGPERGSGSPAYLSIYGLLSLRGVDVAGRAQGLAPPARVLGSLSGANSYRQRVLAHCTRAV
jgi:hypothetical protein